MLRRSKKPSQVAAQMLGPPLTGNLRGADPAYDYAYGDNVASYQPNSRPYYQFAKANQMPTAGAMEYGNETQWLAWKPLIGPAVGAAIQFRTIYNVKPIYQSTGAAAQTGLGGVVHGQIALQPLSDPYYNESYT